MIEITNLSHAYIEHGEKVEILKNVNLTISKGEFLAIIGNSGSGKTTFLNILSGILDAETGSIKYNGQEINGISQTMKSQFRKENIGFVFQDFKLIPYYSALDNVMLPFIHYKNKHELLEEAKLKLSLVELDGKTFERIPKKLSGGEKQRVAIARALMGNSKVLICDEPTGNLDTKNRDLVMDLLLKLKKQGQTIVLVTHDMEITHYCDRILKLCDGQFEELTC